VSPAQVQERVAALTDAEVAQMAQQIDSAPAGANEILGTIVFIFLILLVTDILGLTKVFPFTRSVR
jgi:Na+-transporting methylmalonyl-CoA/oxaloacetate decarboxylase gamma subunit